MASVPERDEFTGTETTGHEWDGIKELNTPLPRWWLWTFYACCIWAVGYWIAMPAWPLISDFTGGVLGYSSRALVAERIAEARAGQRQYLDRIDAASTAEIAADAELLGFAMAGGRSAFAVNCSQCHGQGAAGFVGYPNLNDDDWIWGGDLEAIEATIAYGIRSGHDEARENEMAAYLRDELLEAEDVAAVTDYVLSLSGAGGEAASIARGAEVFAENCAACHQEGGVGSSDLGAPDLADKIWLYGGDRETVHASIANGRGGVMPNWDARLDSATIKQLAIYVHSLGGGE